LRTVSTLCFHAFLLSVVDLRTMVIEATLVWLCGLFQPGGK
jgi:hypothetical protein